MKYERNMFTHVQVTGTTIFLQKLSYFQMQIMKLCNLQTRKHQV